MLNLAAQVGHGRDDRNGDKRGDQGVFDRRRYQELGSASRAAWIVSSGCVIEWKDRRTLRGCPPFQATTALDRTIAAAHVIACPREGEDANYLATAAEETEGEMSMSNGRTAECSIDPMFLDRWSSRAFTGEPISAS
jgi:hypothetical protein